MHGDLRASGKAKAWGSTRTSLSSRAASDIRQMPTNAGTQQRQLGQVAVAVQRESLAHPLRERVAGFAQERRLRIETDQRMSVGKPANEPGR